MTSRSRWMASWGTRSSGRSTRSRRDLAGRRVDDPARQAEVAVEPGVEQHAAVDLDAELAAARPAGVGPRLDPQVRAVGVGADEPEHGSTRSAATPRHQRAAPAEVVRTRARQRLRLGCSREAGGAETVGDGGHDVVRRRRGVDERAQVAGGAEVRHRPQSVGRTPPRRRADDVPIRRGATCSAYAPTAHGSAHRRQRDGIRPPGSRRGLEDRPAAAGGGSPRLPRSRWCRRSSRRARCR